MKSIFTKMLLVQKALKPIPKDETNPHFKSKYFDINGVVSQLRPILNDAGLVVFQPLEDGRIVTMVSDPETGESISFPFALPETSDLQKLGGAITYLRRYALVSLFLLEAEDDDGNQASQGAPTHATSPVQFSKAVQATINAPASLGTCKDCGAGNAWSAGKQKAYCSAKCWLQPTKQEVPPPPADDGFGQLEQIPF
jgi:hypothetical protein